MQCDWYPYKKRKFGHLQAKGPGIDPSVIAIEGINLAKTLVLDFQPLDIETLNFYWLSHPVYSLLRLCYSSLDKLSGCILIRGNRVREIWQSVGGVWLTCGLREEVNGDVTAMRVDRSCGGSYKPMPQNWGYRVNSSSKVSQMTVIVFLQPTVVIEESAIN